MKYDGFRALAIIENGACRLVSRRAFASATLAGGGIRRPHAYKSFPGLCASLAALPHEAILDGEIVCLDRDGRPQFDQLFYRRGEPYFYVFDLPYLDGRDLRELTLIERKRILRRIVPVQGSRLLYVGHIEGRGIDLFREVCTRDLEGIVAKWKHGSYLSGDQTSWVKIKNPAYSQWIGRWERFQRKQTARESTPILASPPLPDPARPYFVRLMAADYVHLKKQEHGLKRRTN